MAIKTYGHLTFDYANFRFVMDRADPHVCIKLKSIFPRIRKTGTVPFYFEPTPENCADLEWFIQRYPMEMTDSTMDRLAVGKELFHTNINDLERILQPDYVPRDIQLKGGFLPRLYQLKAAELHAKVKRFLLGDDLGLGKTLSAVLTFLNPGTLPAAVVVQTHLPNQWKDEGIEKFTNLKAHIIKGTKPYDLPPADVYIFKYSNIAGWVNTFSTGFYKSVVFDECQEFRRIQSEKYAAGQKLAESVEYVLGLTATPVYNYGDEIYNVMQVIAPGNLGTAEEFTREWCTYKGGKTVVEDPKALGTYLRDKFLMVRRTRQEVGRELPVINKIIHTVDYDHKAVGEFAAIAESLAMRVFSGSFTERGQASRELDMLARLNTGISKASYVAEYVRVLLENDIPVLVGLWHREVYKIMLEALADFSPAMYTGSESPSQKEQSKKDFISGKTKVMFISLRSGAGLDGLQNVCHDLVIGELDWSPKVHDQLAGRLRRDLKNEDEEPHQVNVHYPISEYGSDPVIVNMLGLKSSQSQGIVDPLAEPTEQYSDESRMKALAQSYLKGRKLEASKQLPLELND